MNQIKVGAILSYLNIVSTNAIGLILTPFIVKQLGNHEYGLYTLIGSMIVYFTLMDFGIGDAVIRYIARFRANGDKVGEAKFLGIIIKLYIPITVLILLIGVFLYFNIESIFGKNFSGADLLLTQQMFSILLLNLCFSLIGNIFLGAINAYERFIYTRSMLIVKYILRSVVIYLILKKGGNALSLVIVDTIFNFIFFFANFYYFRKVLGIKIIFPQFDFNYVREIFSFSFWLFLASLISQFQWQGGQIILALYSTPSKIAVFAIGTVLGSYYGAFSGAITSMFLPHATKQIVNNSTPAQLTIVMTKIGRVSSYLLIFIFSGFVFFGQQFIDLWVGKFYRESYFIAIIIMFVSTFPLIQAYANSILEAKKMVRYKTLIYLGFIIAGIAGGFFCFKWFGIIGVAGSISAGWLVSIIMLNIFYIRKLDLNILSFYRDVMKPQVVPLLAILILGYSIRLCFDGTSWMNLFIKILMYSAVYGVIYFIFVLSKEEKRLIFK